MAVLEVGENRRLKMHNKLLLDVIRRQAGTLDKAVLEGVMNGVEAGASKIDISFSPGVADSAAILKIVDDGTGISSLEEIEQFFETFGQPHNETENKIWAQFRMGRGQLFSFGKNTWRTGTFRMVVDIDGMGLDYRLETDLDPVEGCEITVELYSDPVKGYYRSLLSFRDYVQRQVEFMPCEIRFNGKQLNHPPETCKWSMEDDNAYYLFGVGSELSIYNMGAFVKIIPITVSGVSGVVVSKKVLQVNFARNDIQSSCPVYKGITDVIRAHRIKRTRKPGRRLTDSERVAALRDLRDGLQLYSDLSSRKMFRTVQGNAMSLADIKKSATPWTVAPSGDTIADRLIESGRAVVLDVNLFLDLGYPLSEMKWFFHWLLNGTSEVFVTDDMVEESSGQLMASKYDNRSRRVSVRAWNAVANLYREFDSFSSDYSQECTPVLFKDMTTEEKLACRLLESCCPMDSRKVGLGVSQTCSAWTDGFSYIVIERKLINQMISRVTYGSVTRLFSILQHELAHSDSTEGTHVHGLEYYRHFHDQVANSSGGLFRFVEYYRNKLSSGLYRIADSKRRAKARRVEARRSKKLGLVKS